MLVLSFIPSTEPLDRRESKALRMPALPVRLEGQRQARAVFSRVRER